MKILYTIPCNKIGGAEMAFNSVSVLKKDNIEILKLDLNLHSNNPLLFLRAIINLYCIIKENEIQFVVSTLWKSHLVVYLVSFFTRIEIIPFIVGIKFFNFFDKICSYRVVTKSKYILVDSSKGKSWVSSLNPKAQVFSFLIHTSLKIDKSRLGRSDDHTLKFIFVGRLNVVKRLDKTFEFLNQLNSKFHKTIFFEIYGPIEKAFDLKNYFDRYMHLNLEYKGVIEHKDFPDIYPKHHFFIQFSDSEGSGMSIIESMRYGLVPVITNVGEVVNYCENSVNSIVYDTNVPITEMVDQFIEVISNESFKNLSMRALETFEHVNSYNDILLETLNKIYSNERDK
jgi:glycosyltransferase involved in cell wall biosynthesis